MASPATRTSPLQPGPWARRVVPLLLGLMMVMLAAVAALGARPDRIGERRANSAGHRPALQWAPVAAPLILVLLWAACGGGGPPPPQDRGTPAGNYNLTLTATTGGVSRTTSRSLKVN